MKRTDAKTEALKVMLSPVERETFQVAADLAGISVSAWLRDRLRGIARGELEEAGLGVPFLRNAGRE